MCTLPQLIVKNSFLGLIFCVLASYLTLFFASNYLESKNQAYKKVLTSLATQVMVNGEKDHIGEVLQSSGQFNKLYISTFSGKNIYHYTNSTDQFILPLLSNQTVRFSIKKIDLTIMYQLDLSHESSILSQYLIGLVVVVTLFIILACWLAIKKYQLFFKRINNQIKNDLSHINILNGNRDNDKSTAALDIPELTSGIEEIKQLLFEQAKHSEILEKQAHIDPLTQLNNRGQFVEYYEQQLNTESSVKFGVLIIIRCSELQTINQMRGYNEGDVYISDIANLLKENLRLYPTAKLFRLNSSNFSCILPNIKLSEAEELAQSLMVKFNDYQETAEIDSVANTGLVYFDKTKTLGELLSITDTAISIAQTQSVNAWYSQKDSDILGNSGLNYGNQNWRQEINAVIENKRISLLLQPIHPSNRNNKMYSEVLARFFNSNDDMLPTTSFVAMAEKLGRIVDIDKLVIESTIKEISDKNMLDQSFGINLSARSVKDEQFFIWLERLLLRDPSIASRLIFEITENGLQQNLKNSQYFIAMLHRVGSRVTVEHFGIALTSFKFFRDLKPDFIKMDSIYTRDIDEDKNNQYFLRLMVDLAHRLNINVLSESVERQEEKNTLNKLFVDGCQGFYIGKPMPL